MVPCFELVLASGRGSGHGDFVGKRITEASRLLIQRLPLGENRSMDFVSSHATLPEDHPKLELVPPSRLVRCVAFVAERVAQDTLRAPDTRVAA